MALKQRKQITGTTEQINQYAGVEGQLVWDKSAKTLVGMSGTAGKNYPLAPKAFVTNEVAKVNAEATKKADKTYVDQQLAKKQPIGDYATNAQLTQGLAGKAPSAHTHTIAEVTGLQTTIDGKADTSYVDAELAEKQPVGDYVTTEELNTGLSGKLGKTEKASSATVADTANSVAWSNVTGKPSIPKSPRAYITETWKSGSSWYRKYSDGFIEQGGRGVQSTAIQPTYRITLNTPFTTKQYIATVINSVLPSDRDFYGLTIEEFTETTMKVSAATGGGIYIWYACGY